MCFHVSCHGPCAKCRCLCLFVVVVKPEKARASMCFSMWTTRANEPMELSWMCMASLSAYQLVKTSGGPSKNDLTPWLARSNSVASQFTLVDDGRCSAHLDTNGHLHFDRLSGPNLTSSHDS